MFKSLSILGFIGFVMCACLLMGCEGRPDTENVNNLLDDLNVDDGHRPPTRAAPMEVVPGNMTLLGNGSVASFSVEGAVGHVTWSVHNIARGRITTQSRDSATYRRTTSGDNVVIATDSQGQAAFATVAQPAVVLPDP